MIVIGAEDKELATVIECDDVDGDEKVVQVGLWSDQYV